MGIEIALLLGRTVEPKALGSVWSAGSIGVWRAIFLLCVENHSVGQQET
jgi:hypothetical protein